MIFWNVAHYEKYFYIRLIFFLLYSYTFSTMCHSHIYFISIIYCVWRVSNGNKLNVETLKYNHNLQENAINLVKHKYINIQNVSNAYSL